MRGPIRVRVTVDPRAAEALLRSDTCERRSVYYEQTLPHVWKSRVRVAGVETTVCSWCWITQP